MTTTGERIAERRRRLHMTQEQIAHLLGTSQKQISKYELGKNDPTGEVIRALARVLDTTADYLLGLTDNPQRPLRNSEDLSPDEKRLVDLYRRKLPNEREKVINLMEIV